MKEKECKLCKTMYLTSARNSSYCSSDCSNSIKKDRKKTYCKNWWDALSQERKQIKKSPRVDSSCLSCFIVFLARKNQKFCSKVCNEKHFRITNKKEIKADQEYRYHNDIQRKISTILRSRLNKALKGTRKLGSAVGDAGCTVGELKLYLENKFESWMNWSNHGAYDPNKKTWQIDHIKPLSVFDLSNEVELKKAVHYTNLQPLSSIENLRKGTKVPQGIIYE